jgi:hypothetical protein
MCTMCTNLTYGNSTCFLVSTLCSRWLALAANTSHPTCLMSNTLYSIRDVLFGDMIREWTSP